MQRLPFRISTSVTLDGDGKGAVVFGPSIGEWMVEQVSAVTTTNVNEPEFNTYINGAFIGGSYSGSRTNDTSFNQRVNAQEKLQCVWVGGDAGATGTVTISGIKEVP